MIGGFAVLSVLAFIIGWAIIKKTDVFSVFIEGAKDGMNSAIGILPALCFLMTAVGMIRESGALEYITEILSPIIDKIGFPPEVLPLAVIRPFSGSGALGFYEELCRNLKTGSFEEMTASVLMGGSETTFYTVAVYYGAVGIKKGRNTVPAALSADIAAAILSAFFVNLLLR
ncbi:MAG: spore maturation protein [Oscillospiraceae bacterium]|nr:spore maturation protein [Oscillospiraceae bacterium]